MLPVNVLDVADDHQRVLRLAARAVVLTLDLLPACWEVLVTRPLQFWTFAWVTEESLGTIGWRQSWQPQRNRKVVGSDVGRDSRRASSRNTSSSTQRASQRLGWIATGGSNGMPHIAPVGGASGECKLRDKR
jgi:hypothetical protein